MQFSERWLRTLVDPALSTEALSHLLTMSGLEVESCEPVGGTIQGVVVSTLSPMIERNFMLPLRRSTGSALSSRIMPSELEDGPRVQMILAQYDVNKNAYLDGDEITAALEPLNAKAEDIDADQNEQITAEELAKYLRVQSAATAAQESPAGPPPSTAMRFFFSAGR